MQRARHGIASGRYSVPLIGGVTARDRKPGAISRLMRFWDPDAWRERIERERNPRVREALRRVPSMLSPGRRKGAVAGTYIGDLAELRKAIMLCDNCDHRWHPAHRAYGYRLDTFIQRANGGCYGVCDGCREPFYPPDHRKLKFYVHESHLGHGYTIRD